MSLWFFVIFFFLFLFEQQIERPIHQGRLVVFLRDSVPTQKTRGVF